MRVLRILFFILCLAVSVMAQDTPADNWSQFRGNHSLTGVSHSNVPTSLKQLWTWEAGEAIESSAAIVGGTVFVGSQKGELVALMGLSAIVRFVDNLRRWVEKRPLTKVVVERTP